MQNNETRWMQKKKLEIRGSDSESGKEERRDRDVKDEDKDTRKRKRQGGRGASALGRELEGWIFFMKGFEGQAEGWLPGLSSNHEKASSPKVKA